MNYIDILERKMYNVINKNVVIIEEKVLFKITLSYAQENVTKFDRFIVYSLYDVKNNYYPTDMTYIETLDDFVTQEKIMIDDYVADILIRKKTGNRKYESCK